MKDTLINCSRKRIFKPYKYFISTQTRFKRKVLSFTVVYTIFVVIENLRLIKFINRGFTASGVRRILLKGGHAVC